MTEEQRIKRNEAARLYYKNNREQCLEAVKKWKQENRERAKGHRKEWGKRNPEKVKESIRKSRVKRKFLARFKK